MWTLSHLARVSTAVPFGYAGLAKSVQAFLDRVLSSAEVAYGASRESVEVERGGRRELCTRMFAGGSERGALLPDIQAAPNTESVRIPLPSASLSRLGHDATQTILAWQTFAAKTHRVSKQPTAEIAREVWRQRVSIVCQPGVVFIDNCFPLALRHRALCKCLNIVCGRARWVACWRRSPKTWSRWVLLFGGGGGGGLSLYSTVGWYYFPGGYNTSVQHRLHYIIYVDANPMSFLSRCRSAAHSSSSANGKSAPISHAMMKPERRERS